ncbi:hypothetical protein PIB30_073438 [Stylosanthes scabra]|uniref:Uncharacterized protein n=1 Tax=Stylosanthes scabra TaxID=79078 RepID=A0ABU6VRA0_9FABA|nr:hypothetical protein [Stylosanthes scabra]
MEDLSMFQRPRTVAMEYEKPGTYGTLLIYPLNRLVECGFVGNTAVNPLVSIICRCQAFARESESLMSNNTRRIQLSCGNYCEQLARTVVSSRLSVPLKFRGDGGFVPPIVRTVAWSRSQDDENGLSEDGDT